MLNFYATHPDRCSNSLSLEVLWLPVARKAGSGGGGSAQLQELSEPAEVTSSQEGSHSWPRYVTEGDGWQGTGGPVGFSDTARCHAACIS